jgi:hypothetical protein
MGRRGSLLVVVPIALVGSLLVSGTGVAWATTNWPVTLHSASSGESHSQTVPSAPTGATAACAAPTTAKTIEVSWTAVTHATYTVYDATTSATGTYSIVASGVTTTSWTSGKLTNCTNYWFEVTATFGSNWTSAKSTATAESTINNLTPFCVQP